MGERRRFRAGACLAALVGVAAPAAPGVCAERVALPASLEGRVEIELRHCEARPAEGVMAATLHIRTGATDVRLANLECGAVARSTGRALFLRGDDALDRIPAHAVRNPTIVFPMDAGHTQCRCRVGDVRDIERDGVDRDLGEPALAPDERRAGPPPPPFELPLRPGALRRETVLVPQAPVRAEPGDTGHPIDRVVAGDRVEVLALREGYKRVRTPAGREGWVPGGTSAVVSARALRVAMALAPARDGGATASSDDRLCRKVPADALADLVFALRPESRTVVVHPLWYALEPGDQYAFEHWAQACYGISRIIDVTRGLDLRNRAWRDPAAAPAP